VGVSNAAATADELARTKRDLEAERAKHDQEKVLERLAAGKSVCPSSPHRLSKANNQTAAEKGMTLLNSIADTDVSSH
jgi:hypothetical protein